MEPYSLPDDDPDPLSLGGRPVLVTGGAGFIGSHVVDRLKEIGADVVVADDLSAGSTANLPADVRLERLDVVDHALADLVGDLHPAVIVHCAANASVVRAASDPIHDARTNILGTINVAEATIAVGARLVYVTTGGALFGQARILPINEDAPVEPVSPYGLSKWVAERYLDLLLPTNVPAIVLRLANVYGPRQRADLEGGVITIFIDRLHRGLPLEVHGDGDQTRDFVDVFDVAVAVVRAVASRSAMTVNVASGRGTSVNELIAMLARVSGRTPTVVHGPARPGDVRHSRLDPRRARELLGWTASNELAVGLDRLWKAALDAPRDTTLPDAAPRLDRSVPEPQ
jgi:UDP-glucose 4-epimerase